MLPAALIWLLLGLTLLLLELLGADFEGLLAAAVAALVLSALGGLVAWPPLVQVALFVALTGLVLLALAGWSRRRPRGLSTSTGGDRAAVISGFDASDEGRVRWQGQSWAAVNLEPGRPLRSGERVVVLGRDGTQLQVLPEGADS